MAQLVRDLMTADPVMLPPDTPVREAAKAMRDREIGDVLVVDGDQLRGLVTDRDIIVRGMASGLDSTSPLAEVCSPDPVTLRPDDPVEDAIRLMSQQAIRRIPVVEEGRAVGIVAIGDLAQDRDPSSVLADISSAKPSS